MTYRLTIALGLGLAVLASAGWPGFALADPLASPPRAGAIDLQHTPEFPALSQPGVSIAPLPGPAVPPPAAPRLPDTPAIGLGPLDATVGLPAAAKGNDLPLPEGRLRMGLTDALPTPSGALLQLEAARPFDLGLSRMLGTDAGVEDASAPRLTLRGEVPAGADSAVSLEAHETMRARVEEAERQIQLRLKMGW